MNSRFTQPRYIVKRQTFAMTGKVRFFTPSNKLALYSEQKMFKLKEDIRGYADEGKTKELLVVKARSIVDFSAAYDVWDSEEQTKVGALRRKGLQSIMRDEWEVLDPNDQPIAQLVEDSMGMAMLRRFLSGLIPQNYDILMGGQRVVDLQQPFNPFRYELNLDFRANKDRLDPRLGFAAALLLAIVEGRQG
jgi:hypothetical protein